MKKIIFSTLSLLAVVMFTTSCGVLRSSVEQRESDVRSYEPVNYVPFTQPLAAEIEVTSADRISETWTFSSESTKGTQSSRKYGKNQSYDLKVEALAKTVAKYNVDMIVAANFDYKRVVNVKGDTGVENIEITVSGYPAKFVNWRSVEKESTDYQWIKDFYGKSIGLPLTEPEGKVMTATPTEMKLVVSDKTAE